MARILVFAAGGVLSAVIIASLPALAVEWARRHSPDVVFRAEVATRTVALTIDDGPTPATAEILDVLEAHDVRATFFVIGAQAAAHPDIMQRLVDGGHELGHHMLHDEPSIALPPDTFTARFETVDSMLDGHGGSRVFRPGSGWYDGRMVAAAARRGYRTVLGSVYPFDAHLPFPRLASWYVRRTASAGDIIVLHDGAERGVRTAAALRTILPALQGAGYRVVPVSELLALESGSAP